MLYEYAVEPELLGTWQSFRSLLGSFSFESGRLIAEFPRKTWCRSVLAEAQNRPEVERKQIVDALDRAKRRNQIVRPVADIACDGRQPWLENAESAVAGNHFHAVVAAKNPRSKESIIVPNDIDPTDPPKLWRVESSSNVVRQPQEIAQALAPLLKRAKELYFIDPYFRPWTKRHSDVLSALLEKLRCHNKAAQLKIEFHCDYKPSKPKDLNFIASTDTRTIRQMLPVGASMTFCRWREKSIHDRFLLTEFGGLSLTNGFDVSQGHSDVTMEILRLGRSSFETRLKRFRECHNDPDFIDRFTIQGSI